MSDNSPAIYGIPQTVSLPVGDIGIGSYIVNDYLITVADSEDGNGYLLTIKKGSQVQEIHLTELKQEAIDAAISLALTEAKESGEFDGNGIERAVLNPDYTLTLYFTDGTNVTTTSIRGETGNGIQSVVMNPDYTLTIIFTDGNIYTTGSIRGLTGNGISAVVLNSDYTLTIRYTDGTSYTTTSIRGAKGDAGVSISGIIFNSDYSLTIECSDGSSYTTDSIRGEKGETGTGISSARLNDDFTLTLNFDDGNSYTTRSIRGETGAKGEKGDPGESFEIHACTSTEYDYDTGIPTIENPRANCLYLVPSSDAITTDLFVEWVYIYGRWEKFGSAEINLDAYAKKTEVAAKLDKPLRDGLSGQILVSNGSGGQTWNDLPVPDWNVSNGSTGFIRNKPDLKAGTGADSVVNRHSLVSGSHSMAVGTNNAASGSDNFVTGNGNNAKGSGSILSGDHNTAELRGSNSVVSGTNNLVSSSNNLVSGTTNSVGGNNSVVSGSNNIVSGNCSFAVGDNNTASGAYSSVEGSNTTASGDRSHAEGTDTTASGNSSHAEGQYSVASGAGSHAEGSVSSLYIIITGEANATVYEQHTSDLIQNTVAECIKQKIGYISYNGITAKIIDANSDGTTFTVDRTLSQNKIESENASYEIYSFASGKGSHAEGVSLSTNSSSHAEGMFTVASGAVAHAEGSFTVASGGYSHAEGYGTIASKSNSHAEGQYSVASGARSHAEGYFTVASGSFSHSQGQNTIANHKGQFAFGTFNTPDPSTAAVGDRGNYVEIVGRGSSENARSNARTLDWNGNEWIAGNFKMGGNSYNDPNAKEVATKEYVDEHAGGGTVHGIKGTWNPNGSDDSKFVFYDSSMTNKVLYALLANGTNDIFVLNINFPNASSQSYVTSSYQRYFLVDKRTETYTNSDTVAVTYVFYSGDVSILESDTAKCINSYISFTRVSSQSGNSYYWGYGSKRFDVTVNGTSVLNNNGVAEIPIATSDDAGVVKVLQTNGVYLNSDGRLTLTDATDLAIKLGNNNKYAVNTSKQHQSVFYGLAKAAGDSTQQSSSNPVGTYTDNAKASIKAMLGVSGETQKVTVSGTAPVIVANQNTRYVCGEVVSLDFTPSAEGICDVIFTSGSTVTVLTVPNTVRFPEWFDPTALEANKTYEINITDGVYGAVMVW